MTGISKNDINFEKWATLTTSDPEKLEPLPDEIRSQK